MNHPHITFTTDHSPFLAAQTTTTTAPNNKQETNTGEGGRRGEGLARARRAGGQGYHITYITPLGTRCAPSGCRVGTPLILSADMGCSVRFGQGATASEGEGVGGTGMVKMRTEQWRGLGGGDEGVCRGRN